MFLSHIIESSCYFCEDGYLVAALITGGAEIILLTKSLVGLLTCFLIIAVNPSRFICFS